MSRALALTDTQMAELRRAAALLPVEGRAAFLRRVAAHLGSAPTNGDVSAAIIAALGDTSVRITTPAFCCDSKPEEKPDG